MSRKTNEILKKDNFLVEVLLDHKGRNNAISRYALAKCLTDNGFYAKPSTIHSIVARVIKERHLPICSINGKGYYWAKSREDILSCINELQMRVDSLTEHINHLKNFIIE